MKVLVHRALLKHMQLRAFAVDPAALEGLEHLTELGDKSIMCGMLARKTGGMRSLNTVGQTTSSCLL
ncbi:MAG: hypothetical protein QXI50_06250 [Candidatus Caldarchaeum sp.]